MHMWWEDSFSLPYRAVHYIFVVADARLYLGPSRSCYWGWQRMVECFMWWLDLLWLFFRPFLLWAPGFAFRAVVVDSSWLVASSRFSLIYLAVVIVLQPLLCLSFRLDWWLTAACVLVGGGKRWTEWVIWLLAASIFVEDHLMSDPAATMPLIVAWNYFGVMTLS